MALKGRDVTLAGIACFFAWGYATSWFPALRWAGYAFVAGIVLAVLGLLALVLLVSRGSEYRQFQRSPRPAGAAFLGPKEWEKELAALRTRQTYTRAPIYDASPKISHALDDVLDLVERDFIASWYSKISPNPIFTNEVDKAIRCALAALRDRLFDVDLPEVLTTRLVPILTAHFRDFYEAERSVRGKKLNRSVTESEELDLAIASKYRDGKLHPAASLAYSDTTMVQQEHLRQKLAGLLPELLPEKLLHSGAVVAIVREIVACAVLFPVMQMLSEPDTWNQLMENYGRSMLQDRSTVRKLRAALDEHAPAPRTSKTVAFPRLMPGDSERKFEKFVRTIRRLNSLTDARRFRNEVTSQLKKDSQQEGQDQVYLRRLEMCKRLLDQRVQLLAAGGDRRALQSTFALGAPTVSRLENASLAELLRDPSGLSYFMEYMDRQHLLSLVQFWLVVDGFRNPLEDEAFEEEEQLPLTLPPWTDSDRLDVAQIEQAYLLKPELKIPESSRRAVRGFLSAGRAATPEQYYLARRAIMKAQNVVLNEMESKYFHTFKKSDLFYKCLASEEASKTFAPPPTSQARQPSPPSVPHLNRATQSYSAAMKPTPAARLATRLNTKAHLNRRAESSSDLSTHTNGNGLGPAEPWMEARRSMDDSSPNPLFDDDLENDPMADSVQSLDQEVVQQSPDTKVVQAVEEALNTIMEDSRPPTSEDLQASLFGNGDAVSSIFSENESKRGSIDVPRPASAAPGKEPEKPSLASLGLVGSALRIGVFEDDLFGDEDKYLSDEPDDADDAKKTDDADEVHEAAPGDLGLAEAITVLTNDIDRLAAQDAVVDSLLRKAELTNNMAELRILRKSKASLQREIRRKELQRQQYVMQESDNSLYGKSTVQIKSIKVGRDSDGKEFALYAIEVQRNAGERMPAATWAVTRRYSEFLELHQRLRTRYPSVRHLDFPRRRVVMKLQSEFLKKRRMALEKYLQQLLLLPDVCRSRDLRAFLSQSVIVQGQDIVDREDKKDMITRLYDSVTDGMEDILGSIPVFDQLSIAGQNLIAAATSQLNTLPPNVNEDAMTAAEAEAELNAFENKELEPFVKPICDIFLEVFELNRGNNWLRGRAVVVVLHQLLGGTIERKLRDNVRLLVQEDAVLRYVALLRDAMWPEGGGEEPPPRGRRPRPAAEKARTRREASLMLATLVPDLAGNVVGRLNAQAASRRIFATFNNSRLNAHLAFTFLDEVIDVLFPGR